MAWRKELAFERILVSLFVVVFVAVGIGLLFGRLLGYQILSVQSSSMAPALQAGHAVIIRAGTTDIKSGDIVAYTIPGTTARTITHRVIGRETATGMFVMKGDNVPLADATVAASSITGVMILAVPLLGHGIDMLKQPLGLAAAVYLPAIAVVSKEYRRLARYYAGLTEVRYMLHGHRRR